MHIIESTAQLEALYQHYPAVGGFAISTDSYTLWFYDQDGNQLTLFVHSTEHIRYTETPYADRAKETIIYEYHAPQEES